MTHGGLGFLQDCRILSLLGQLKVRIAKGKKRMEKLSQMSETHPVLERREGVKVHYGNTSMGYLLLVLVSTYVGEKEAALCENHYY